MARQWVKLWTKQLENPEIAELPDYLYRRWIEILMLAGKNDADGLLQPVRKMAYILRLKETQLSENLMSLNQIGVVHQDDAGNWYVTNWKKHQYSDSTERVRRYREKHKDEDDDRYSNGYKNVTCISSPLISSDSSSLFKLYESEIGTITARVADVLNESLDEYPHEWFEPAISEAVRNNARNWAYVEAILKNWKAHGFRNKNGKPKSRASPGSPPTEYTAEAKKQAAQEEYRRQLAKLEASENDNSNSVAH